jgi:hypothetical protein
MSNEEYKTTELEEISKPHIDTHQKEQGSKYEVDQFEEEDDDDE